MIPTKKTPRGPILLTPLFADSPTTPGPNPYNRVYSAYFYYERYHDPQRAAELREEAARESAEVAPPAPGG